MTASYTETINGKEYTVSDSNDIASVVQSAVSECDVLYIPTDNTMAGNTESINNIALPAGVPIIAGEEGICSGCGDQEIQRLHSRITGAFGHNIEQFPIGLVVPNLGNRFSHKINDADTPKEYRNLVIS